MHTESAEKEKERINNQNREAEMFYWGLITDESQGKRKLFRIDNAFSLQVGYNLGVFEVVFMVFE
jgi:hypothetical protein